jgi:Ca2+/H+ antiporter
MPIEYDRQLISIVMGLVLLCFGLFHFYGSYRKETDATRKRQYQVQIALFGLILVLFVIGMIYVQGM